MDYINKQSVEPLIFEQEDWTSEEWATILKIFSMKEAERIVISGYRFEAYGTEKNDYMNVVQEGIQSAYHTLFDAYYNKSEDELRDAISGAMADLDDVIIWGRNDD